MTVKHLFSKVIYKEVYKKHMAIINSINKKGAKPIEFHTFSYKYLSLFIDNYFTSSKSASCTSPLSEAPPLFA